MLSVFPLFHSVYLTDKGQGSWATMQKPTNAIHQKKKLEAIIPAHRPNENAI